MDVINVLNSSEIIKIEQLYTNIAKSITSSLEISKVIAAIMEQIEGYFCPNNWSLLRLDPLTQELYFVVAKGLDAEIAGTIRLKLGEGIAGYVAQTGQSIFIEDAKSDNRFSSKLDQLSGFETKSLIAVPIIFQDRVLGIIEIINPINKNSFSMHELNILQTIADFSAIALENAITHEKMAWISIHDPLTKIYNRAEFENLMQTCRGSHDANHHAAEYVIAIGIDINDFKYVNDTYGHASGDQVLVQTATILQSYCRRNDYAFRVGGDEFIMIIMDLREKDVQPVLNRIRAKMSEDAHHLDYGCSFSFGIASGLKAELPQLTKLADDSMYVNKASKRLSHT